LRVSAFTLRTTRIEGVIFQTFQNVPIQVRQ
jgi:hypothetical protein